MGCSQRQQQDCVCIALQTFEAKILQATAEVVEQAEATLVMVPLAASGCCHHMLALFMQMEKHSSYLQHEGVPTAPRRSNLSLQQQDQRKAEWWRKQLHELKQIPFQIPFPQVCNSS